MLWPTNIKLIGIVAFICVVVVVIVIVIVVVVVVIVVVVVMHWEKWFHDKIMSSAQLKIQLYSRILFGADTWEKSCI